MTSLNMRPQHAKNDGIRIGRVHPILIDYFIFSD
jgi:hypothetical protein